MRTFYRIASALRTSTNSRIVTGTLTILFSFSASSQTVTEVVTDYAGYWRSGSTSINSAKPDNSTLR